MFKYRFSEFNYFINHIGPTVDGQYISNY